MKKEIIDYILGYIFQRIKSPGIFNYDDNSQTLIIGHLQLKMPPRERNIPKLVKILDHSIPFFRYVDDISIKISNQDQLISTFDLLGEVYDHLTLEREKELNFDSSAKEVFLPSLDMKIYHFFDLLRPFMDIEYRDFQGKTFALCLSHDIDRTGDSWLYRIITHFFQALKQKRPSLIFHGLFGENKEANFQTIINKERSYDAQATWFYLSRYGLKKNADYHLSDKIAQKSMNLLQEANHELGLHIPFMEMTKENILIEKNKIPHSKSIGVRIHHLRGDFFETLPLLSECGFLYDTTYGFNWNMAYRFGTSIPFNPIINEEILKIFELPMNIMDLQVTSLEDFQQKIQELFQVLVEVHGVCVINWHNNRFNELKYGDIWTRSFEILLNEGKKNNAWITSLSNVIHHYKK